MSTSTPGVCSISRIPSTMQSPAALLASPGGGAGRMSSQVWGSSSQPSTIPAGRLRPGRLTAQPDVRILGRAGGGAKLPAKHLVRPYRQVSDSHAGCVVHGVSDRSGCADDADLADALRPHRVQVRVVLV